MNGTRDVPRRGRVGGNAGPAFSCAPRITVGGPSGGPCPQQSGGLAAAGRYLRLTVRCVDRPGQLAQLLTLIGEAGANVDDVAHRRHDPGLGLGEVEVDLSVETRGEEQSGRLVEMLGSAGYTVRPGRVNSRTARN